MRGLRSDAGSLDEQAGEKRDKAAVAGGSMEWCLLEARPDETERTLPRGQPCPRSLGGLHGICPGVACLRSAAAQGSMPNKSNALRRLIEQLAAMHLHHGLAQVAHGVTEVEERTAWVY